MPIVAKTEEGELDADSYLILFTVSDTHVGGLLILGSPPISRRLTLFRRGVASDAVLKKSLKGFDIRFRTVGVSNAPNHYEVVFAVNNRSRKPIDRLIGFARQCRLIRANPVETDVRNMNTR